MVLAFVSALVVGSSPVAAAGADKLEPVMSKGDKILATTEAGRIGIIVSFAKVADRRQINVEVWQITINGEPPKKLKGADDAKVQFVNSKAEQVAP